MPVSFPKDIYEELSFLKNRGGLSPSYLSTLISYMVLPATRVIDKNKPLQNDASGFCSARSWHERSDCSLDLQAFRNKYKNLQKTHTARVVEIPVDGLETLEIFSNHLNLNQRYEILCVGNGYDAMHFMLISSHIKPNINYIFWNYPQVGCSTGKLGSIDYSLEAGYKQAKNLIEQGIPAQNITMYGHSLGGGVALHVARRLHEEGYRVNLKIDRSFASIAQVPSELIKNLIQSFKQERYFPLLSSVVTFGILGIGMGVALAGFIATAGLIIASIIASIGYLVALIAYQLDLPAAKVNETFSTIALLFNHTINIIGGIIGGITAISGLIAGILIGIITGALLSIQLLVTDKPLSLSLLPAFRAVLLAACCEMNSVNEMQRLLAIKNLEDNKPENKNKVAPKIEISNTVDDQVIPVEASLLHGLQIKPGKKFPDDALLKKKVASFWYYQGRHDGELDCPINLPQAR